MGLEFQEYFVVVTFQVVKKKSRAGQMVSLVFAMPAKMLEWHVRTLGYDKMLTPYYNFLLKETQ